MAGCGRARPGDEVHAAPARDLRDAAGVATGAAVRATVYATTVPVP